MKVAFRTDASLQIGTGHVMRCLTLADALREQGAQCTFICRLHAGHILDLIKQRGHQTAALTHTDDLFTASADLAHADWLGTDWSSDAEQTRQALGDKVVDWFVVDHYALDHRWESALQQKYRKLLVIDDLADRTHTCDVLLDQTFGRDFADYSSLVRADCQLLCGSQYALLRPEFAAKRDYSIERRAQPVLRELLITMGGIDKDNATAQVLKALCSCSLPVSCRITVVMGATAPWLDEVRTQVQNMPWQTRVLVGVSDMAQLMAESDLAIGAAGATSWERCCLGLPSILLVLAENQIKIARELELAGAAAFIATGPNWENRLAAMLDALSSSSQGMSAMSEAAAAIVNGMGSHSVIAQMIS